MFAYYLLAEIGVRISLGLLINPFPESVQTRAPNQNSKRDLKRSLQLWSSLYKSVRKTKIAYSNKRKNWRNTNKMTGGPRKIETDANVYLVLKERKIKVDDAAVFIHVRGYMRARVTHVDIEDRVLGKIIHRGRGNMLKIVGFRGGIEINPKEPLPLRQHLLRNRQRNPSISGVESLRSHSKQSLHPIIKFSNSFSILQVLSRRIKVE